MGSGHCGLFHREILGARKWSAPSFCYYYYELCCLTPHLVRRTIDLGLQSKESRSALTISRGAGGRASIKCALLEHNTQSITSLFFLSGTSFKSSQNSLRNFFLNFKCGRKHVI